MVITGNGTYGSDPAELEPLLSLLGVAEGRQLQRDLRHLRVLAPLALVVQRHRHSEHIRGNVV